MGSGVCFSHDAIRALQSRADSPTDEMEQEGWLCSLPLVLRGSVFDASGTRHSWTAWLRCVPQHTHTVSGIFGFPGAPKLILAMVAVQQLSKTIYFYKEFSKQ